MQENLSNYLQLLCDNAPVGMIITNSNNTILYVNQSARGLLDYDDDSSATLSSCIPTDEIRCSGGKPKSVYFNKKTLSVSVKTAKLEKQLFDLWYIIDISKEEQQADEMHCLKTILDCIDEGVVMSDLENKITLYNKPYAKSEGLSPDQVIGKHLDEVYDTNQHLTGISYVAPTLLMDFSCKARSSLACIAIGIELISSRNNVPFSACSKTPCEFWAPVNEPLTVPNRMLSSKDSGTAAQLIATKGWSAHGLLLWMLCANSSFPVPVSP
jgi:hypothetical protein